MSSDSPKTISPMADASRKFERVARLVGPSGFEKLREAHVLIVGLGGVGSWAAESLVRSGLGRITLIDFDRICSVNFNRQIQALDGFIGESKAEVLTDRLKKINPEATFEVHAKFLNIENIDAMFSGKSDNGRPDFVIDAIDHVTSKCFLLDYCRRNSFPVVCSTGSGGRLDPTRIEVADLSETQVDPLAKTVRRVLRQKYGFQEKGEFGIPAVYSKEQPIVPCDLPNQDDFRCQCKYGVNDYQSCSKRNVVMGTAAFVTGAFGFACASLAVRYLLSK
ncbi:MAG: hypothetical protein A3K03_01370 [Bdellovibrionales bacterium RIFOXYD1_FULL_44_7]|nr:MAG: hypothetical protein A3K03_01370 [Bdellovibrionales bacterium RIFOXYD1_FULL_44_7]